MVEDVITPEFLKGIPAGEPRRHSAAPQHRHPLVTQGLLAEFEQRKLEKEEAERRYSSLREDLLELFDSGAQVEEGELWLRVEESRQQRFSFAALSKLLGASCPFGKPA